MRILDKYVLRNFLMPFFYCFFGFLAIWLVFDLSNTGKDFLEAKVPLPKIGYFYATQLPAIMVICLPVGLLLALLSSLSRMSRSNELISMLSAGQSMSRVLFPLMMIGLIATGVSTALNYEMAPHSEAVKKVLLDQIVRGKVRSKISEQLFRNRADRRTWYVQKMRDDFSELQGIHITQQDARGNITEKHYARRATLNPQTSVWTLFNGKSVRFNPAGDVLKDRPFTSRDIPGWSETPWRIASANLRAENLSVPELRDYLHFNNDFPDVQLAPYRTHYFYRWALPWTCLVVVFIAAPLGVVYSRRGVLAGVASSIFIFFGMIFLTNLFLALGSGSRMPPAAAAWAPNAIFGSIGLFLFYLRASNRELPKFRLPARRPTPLPAAASA